MYRCLYGQSFFPRTTRDWNNLPITVSPVNTVEKFMAALKACVERKKATPVVHNFRKKKYHEMCMAFISSN